MIFYRILLNVILEYKLTWIFWKILWQIKENHRLFNISKTPMCPILPSVMGRQPSRSGGTWLCDSRLIIQLSIWKSHSLCTRHFFYLIFNREIHEARVAHWWCHMNKSYTILCYLCSLPINNLIHSLYISFFKYLCVLCNYIVPTAGFPLRLLLLSQFEHNTSNLKKWLGQIQNYLITFLIFFSKTSGPNWQCTGPIVHHIGLAGTLTHSPKEEQL